jgi:alginate O-acetyltransferase complex protein AlgI
MNKKLFSPMEIDALGEMMNISLGSSATAVSNLLEHRVDITTPKVTSIKTEDFALGARRFAVGLAKKVLLANAVGALWDGRLAAWKAGTLTAAGGWLGLLAFGFQIYFDFSGYSDMAIGLGRIFGFRFNENFDHPYLSASVTEFWRRWHMSLTGWFREYLYIPLGGSRCGAAKTLRNILIVWLCTGFWHGASWNFILWGLYFAAWLVLEKYVLRQALKKTPGWIKHLYTLAVVFVGWGIFAMEDLAVCGGYFSVCFGGGRLWSAADGYILRSYGLTFLILILASTTLGQRLWRQLPRQAERVLTPVLMGLGLVLCTAYLVDGSYNPFLYFRF